jgi:hypothetical protein
MDAGIATHGEDGAVASVSDGASPVATLARLGRRRTNDDMKSPFYPWYTSKIAGQTTASLSSHYISHKATDHESL